MGKYETTSFVLRCALDPALRDKFVTDPDAAMEGHNLDDEDKAVLKTQDDGKIREHMGGHAPPGCVVVVV